MGGGTPWPLAVARRLARRRSPARRAAARLDCRSVRGAEALLWESAAGQFRGARLIIAFKGKATTSRSVQPVPRIRPGRLEKGERCMNLSTVVMKRWRFVYLASVVATLVVGLGIWNPLKAMADRSKAPAYKVDPFWPKPMPDRWVTGDVAGTCVDSNDHIFTVNRAAATPLTAKELIVGSPSPPVIEFDRAGNTVNYWGEDRKSTRLNSSRLVI